MKTHYVSKEDADKIRCARGFKSFKEWAKENRKGKSNRHYHNDQWRKALENEYDTLIAPNL